MKEDKAEFMGFMGRRKDHMGTCELNVDIFVDCVHFVMAREGKKNILKTKVKF